MLPTLGECTELDGVTLLPKDGDPLPEDRDDLALSLDSMSLVGDPGGSGDATLSSEKKKRRRKKKEEEEGGGKKRGEKKRVSQKKKKQTNKGQRKGKQHPPGCTGVKRCVSSDISGTAVPKFCEDEREIFLLVGTGLLNVSPLDSESFDSLVIVIEAVVSDVTLLAAPVTMLGLDPLLFFSSPLLSPFCRLPRRASNK